MADKNSYQKSDDAWKPHTQRQPNRVRITTEQVLCLCRGLNCTVNEWINMESKSKRWWKTCDLTLEESKTKQINCEIWMHSWLLLLHDFRRYFNFNFHKNWVTAVSLIGYKFIVGRSGLMASTVFFINYFINSLFSSCRFVGLMWSVGPLVLKRLNFHW